jgi:hypothetical protein
VFQEHQAGRWSSQMTHAELDHLTESLV